jgi:hypothetical protein
VDREDLSKKTERKIPCSTQVVRIRGREVHWPPSTKDHQVAQGRRARPLEAWPGCNNYSINPSTPPLTVGGSSNTLDKDKDLPTRANTPRTPWIDRGISRSAGDPNPTPGCGSIHPGVNNPKCRPHGPIKIKSHRLLSIRGA